MVESVLRDPVPGAETGEPGPEPSTGARSLPRKRLRSIWTPLAAGATYCAVALLANYPTWPGDPSRIRAGDLDQMVTFLAWTPHAIGHWQNLFATDWLNYPAGVNLAQNTTVPLLGLVTAPLTLAVSPLASLNLLLWLAYPLSAFSMFVVLRRWVEWDLAAFVGGALYGFSPYVVTQSVNHLNLAFVPLPPLILLAAYETVRPDATHPLRWGAVFGALVVAQFFVSPEIAATSVMVVVLCAVVLAVADTRSVVPALRRGGRGLVLAVGLAFACVAYPVWMMMEGPYRFRGPPHASGVSADLLSSIAPTNLQALSTNGLATAGSHLAFGHTAENGSYLGIPLILLLIILVALCRRNRWIHFAAVLAVLTTVLSLGPYLVVGNHVTFFPLPWDLIERLPLANNVLTVRLSLYTAIFVSLLVALAMTDLRSRWRSSRTPPVAPRGRRSSERDVRLATLGGLATLAVVSALALIPAWPLETAPADVPAFFTSGAVDRIPYGSVALISPYPSVEEVQPQMWQAVAGMRFRIIGGYLIDTDPTGAPSPYPQVLRPTQVERFLWAKATGGVPYPSGTVPQDTNQLACGLRTFLLRYRVASVVSTNVGAEPGSIDALFVQALGHANYGGGGVTAWFGVRDDLARVRSCR